MTDAFTSNDVRKLIKQCPPNAAMSRRILISAEFYGMGGTEAHVMNLCALLHQNGVEVTVATRYGNPSVPLIARPREFGVHLIRTPFADRFAQFRTSTLWAYATWPWQLSRDYDLLYTLGVTKFTTFLARHLKRGGRLVWHPFGNPEHLRDAQLARRRRLDDAVAESPIHQRVLEQLLPSNVNVIHLPCLCNASDHSVRRARTPSDPVRIAFLGRYDDNKGVLRLLRLWPTLRLGPAQLDFYGDGPLRLTLEEEAQRLQLGNVRVNGGWQGHQQLAAILARTDVVVLPSASEGIPLVLVEAMSHGVPFVATNVGAIPWLAESNPDVRVTSFEEFPRALSDIVTRLQEDDSHHARLKAYYEKRFGHAVASQKWLSFILNSSGREEPRSDSAATSRSNVGRVSV